MRRNQLETRIGTHENFNIWLYGRSDPRSPFESPVEAYILISLLEYLGVVGGGGSGGSVDLLTICHRSRQLLVQSITLDCHDVFLAESSVHRKQCLGTHQLPNKGLLI